jgi:hypothetical protein
MVEVGEAEGVSSAIFDLDESRAWRECEIGGGDHRRPQPHGRLTTPESDAPFVRADAAGRLFNAGRVA